MRPTRFPLQLCAVAVAASLCTLSAWAVEPDAPKPADASKPKADQPKADKKDTAAKEDDAEVLVITATKRPTSLMRTPLAVSALSQQDLQRQNIAEARDLAGKIPNLQLATGADSGTATTVRGVTSTDFTEVGEGAVSFHIDGAYSPRPQGALALMYDLDRVEILRGPQGTLFGMNSPGGSINIVPKQPEFSDSYGSADLEFGNFNQRQIRAFANFGLSETFALRASLFRETRDGFLKQEQDFTDLASPHNHIEKDGIPDVDQRRNRAVSKSDYYNNSNQWGARLIARWEPSDRWAAKLTYERFADDGAGDMMYVDCEQTAGTVNACNHSLRYAKVNVPGERDMDIDDWRLHISYDLNDSNAVEYRWSLQDQSRYQIEDVDGGAHAADAWSDIGAPSTHEAELTGYYPIWDETWETRFSRYKTTQHELQFKSTGDGKLQYVAGLFYLLEEKSIRYDMEMLAIKTWYEDEHAPLGFNPDGLPDSWRFDQNRRTTESKAGFAQFDYQVTDAFTATLGFRRTEDKKTDEGGVTYAFWWGNELWYNGHHTPDGVRAHQSNDLTWDMGQNANGGPVMPASEPNHVNKSWEQDTYRLGFSYTLDDKQMLFGSVATGYKMGGMYEMFDFCAHGCLQLLTYEPENVTTYELGYKGTLADGALRFNTTLFLSDYTDMQNTGEKVVGTNENPASADFGQPVIAWTTDNLTESEIYGLEVEWVWMPWKNGKVSGFFAWLHTEITDGGVWTDGYACNEREILGQAHCGDAGHTSITGNQLPFAPEFSTALNFEQVVGNVGNFEVVPHLSWRWQDDMWLTIDAYDGAHLSQKQKAYSKLDAGVRFDAVNGDYYFEVAGTNLTDEQTKNFFGFNQGMVRGSYDPPRQLFVRFGVNF